MSDDTQKASEVQVLTVNGTGFVTGLYWRALSTPRNFMSEARRIGRNEGMDIVVLRQTPQKTFAGFVKAGSGVQKGQYSIASALAQELGDNWLGVFPAGDGRYLAAGVNAGTIIPQGDRLGDVEFAKSFIRKLIRYFDQSSIRIFAPPEVEMPDAEALALSDILTRSRYPRECQLRPLTFGLSKRELTMLGGAGLVITLGLIAWWQWQQHLAEQERLAELERKKALAALEAKSGREARASALEYPWASKPAPSVALERCAEGIQQAPWSVGGWQFVRAGCNGDELAISYSRVAYQTVNDFTDAAESTDYDHVDVDEAGTRGVLSTDLDLVPYGDETLIAKKPALQDLRSLYQAKGVDVSIESGKASDYSEELVKAGAISWQSFDFEVRANELDFVTLEPFYQPGLRLSELLMDQSDDGITWVLRGTQYVD